MHENQHFSFCSQSECIPLDVNLLFQAPSRRYADHENFTPKNHRPRTEKILCLAFGKVWLFCLYSSKTRRVGPKSPPGGRKIRGKRSSHQTNGRPQKLEIKYHDSNQYPLRLLCIFPPTTTMI